MGLGGMRGCPPIVATVVSLLSLDTLSGRSLSRTPANSIIRARILLYKPAWRPDNDALLFRRRGGDDATCTRKRSARRMF